MKTIFQKIWQLAEPYLDTRKNDIHTKISTECAYRLLEREGGDQDIVIPAIILHDVGWKRVPENLQLKTFGQNTTYPELNRLHEIEGVKIAKEILENVHYDKDKVAEILKIIEGHDSRKEPLSLNDKIVKDADKLSRYNKEFFIINMKRFKETYSQELDRIRSNLYKWLLTDSAKEIARAEIKNRAKELDDSQL